MYMHAGRSCLVFLATLVVSTIAAREADLPVYCRLLSVGLSELALHPITKDLSISLVEHVPVIGDINISVSHLEIDAAVIGSCDASEDEGDVFNVGVQHMRIRIKQLQWEYKEVSWPHTYDRGDAKGNASASFNLSVDLNKEVDKLFAFELDQFEIDAGATHHTWITPFLLKLLKLARPVVSAVLQHEIKEVINKDLTQIHKDGACVFISSLLKDIDFTKFQFISYEPTKVHVPLIGDIDVSVNSTYITQPTSMQCLKAGFTGDILSAHIENVSFEAGFKWAYQKNGSGFWHNQGNGTAGVIGGTDFNINLLKPTATAVKIDIPGLTLRLSPESDKWMYEALQYVLVPLVRHSMQLFGGKFLSHEITKCLEDPECPHMPPSATHEKIAVVPSVVAYV